MARPINKNTFSPTSLNNSMKFSPSPKLIAIELVEELCALQGTNYQTHTCPSFAHILRHIFSTHLCIIYSNTVFPTTTRSMYMPIIIQRNATIHSLFISVNCSTCFGWYFDPSSGAHVTVSTPSGISTNVTATCRERDWTGHSR
jgi:hypothetical protein